MKLKVSTKTFVDCSDFDDFVEEIYGRKYSTVNGYSGDDRLGHNTVIWVDSEQWKADNDWANSPEEIERHKQWVEEMKVKSPWFTDYREDFVSFEDWSKSEGWDSHNNCPVIDEMVWHLRQDGHDVPPKFEVLVDW